jgi:hypothetical protein
MWVADDGSQTRNGWRPQPSTARLYCSASGQRPAAEALAAELRALSDGYLDGPALRAEAAGITAGRGTPARPAMSGIRGSRMRW